MKPLWKAYDLPRSADLCCYWFEQARARIAKPASLTRIGLLATQGIRGGDNRKVLERIALAGGIFMAWSDRDWILDGAAVHVSIVGFDDGSDETRQLNGETVAAISPNLRSDFDNSRPIKLPENQKLEWSIGTQKGGDFDLDSLTARMLLASPAPTAGPIADVVKPWISGVDITGRNRGKWVIYFDPSMKLEDASTFEVPFEHADRLVRHFRQTVRREAYRERWWIHQEARLGLVNRLKAVGRFVVTPTLTKYRIFAWERFPTLPDKQTTVFIRSDDYFFGVIHSSVHELWARRMGSQLREVESGFRYTPSTCFETFPLPWPPGNEDESHPTYQRISVAAKSLDEKRERWLNPPEWIEPLAAKIDAADDFADVPADARPLIRQSALMAAAAKDARLKNRTLTKLYNERPTWLKLAHEQLDRAVLAAYAAVDPAGGWSEDWAAVWVDSGAGQILPADHSLSAMRAEVDQKVLAGLLALNRARSER